MVRPGKAWRKATMSSNSDTGSGGRGLRSDRLSVLARGLLGHCPQCGQGRLLRRYLKVNPNCSHCGEGFAHLNADDMPPWLTILIVGHLLAPEVWYVQRNFDLPVWVEQVLWVSLALILTLTLLPRSKGFVLALLWVLQRDAKEKAVLAGQPPVVPSPDESILDQVSDARVEKPSAP